MACLITPDPKFLSKECTLSYKELADSRVMLMFDKSIKKKYEQSCNNFYTNVVLPMKGNAKGVINIGQYVVFKVSDIKALLEASPDADYIQIHNRLDDEGYNKMLIIPYESAPGGDPSKGRRVMGETTLLVEGLPCPPHPKCPKEVISFE